MVVGGDDDAGRQAHAVPPPSRASASASVLAGWSSPKNSSATRRPLAPSRSLAARSRSPRSASWKAVQIARPGDERAAAVVPGDDLLGGGGGGDDRRAGGERLEQERQGRSLLAGGAGDIGHGQQVVLGEAGRYAGEVREPERRGEPLDTAVRSRIPGQQEVNPRHVAAQVGEADEVLAAVLGGLGRPHRDGHRAHRDPQRRPELERTAPLRRRTAVRIDLHAAAQVAQPGGLQLRQLQDAARQTLLRDEPAVEPRDQVLQPPVGHQLGLAAEPRHEPEPREARSEPGHGSAEPGGAVEREERLDLVLAEQHRQTRPVQLARNDREIEPEIDVGPGPRGGGAGRLAVLREHHHDHAELPGKLPRQIVQLDLGIVALRRRDEHQHARAGVGQDRLVEDVVERKDLAPPAAGVKAGAGKVPGVPVRRPQAPCLPSVPAVPGLAGGRTA